MATHKGRDLFKELIEGVDAIRRHHEGKLRPRAGTQLDECRKALDTRRNQDIADEKRKTYWVASLG